MTTDDRQRIRDEEHLKLLSIFHYVSGGITAFSTILGIFSLIVLVRDSVRDLFEGQTAEGATVAEGNP